MGDVGKINKMTNELDKGNWLGLNRNGFGATGGRESKWFNIEEQSGEGIRVCSATLIPSSYQHQHTVLIRSGVWK